MTYANSAGLGVNNHYGRRDTGGFKGELPSCGPERQWVVDLSVTGPTNLFPTVDGSAWVTGLDETYTTGGAVTDADIGAADINAATEAAPVQVADANTGIFTVAGPTGGFLIVKYKIKPGI